MKKKFKFFMPNFTFLLLKGVMLFVYIHCITIIIVTLALTHTPFKSAPNTQFHSSCASHWILWMNASKHINFILASPRARGISQTSHQKYAEKLCVALSSLCTAHHHTLMYTWSLPTYMRVNNYCYYYYWCFYMSSTTHHKFTYIIMIIICILSTLPPLVVFLFCIKILHK